MLSIEFILLIKKASKKEAFAASKKTNRSKAHYLPNPGRPRLNTMAQSMDIDKREGDEGKIIEFL
jgi:hypothetical protein